MRAQGSPDPAGPRATHILLTRLDYAFRLLNYYDVTAYTLLEQHNNLLSLVSTYFEHRTPLSTSWCERKAFNLETEIQGQAVARLNTLAFVFIPLSSVAVGFPSKIKMQVTKLDLDSLWNYNLYSARTMVPGRWYSCINDHNSHSLDCKQISWIRGIRITEEAHFRIRGYWEVQYRCCYFDRKNITESWEMEQIEKRTDSLNYSLLPSQD